MSARTPQDVAREAVKLLAARKLPPTPDNFQSVYHEVAGTRPLQPFPLEKWRLITQALPDATPAQQRFKRQLSQAVTMHSWDSLQKAIVALLQGSSAAQRTESRGVEVATDVTEVHLFPPDLLEQVARVVDHALPAVGNDDAKILEQARELVDYLRLEHQHPATLRKMLADFAFRLSFVAEEQALIRSTLLQLLQLVFEHIGELSPGNAWLHEQMAALVKACEPPLSVRRLEDLERQLKNVIHKQGDAAARSQEAQTVIKEALSSFIVRLADMTEHSDHYQHQMEHVAHKLENAGDVTTLAPLIQEALDATRSMALDAKRANEEMLALRERTTEAESEIKRLQDELDRLSQVACHDMLTGVLNRKGLDEVVEKELSLARRRESSVCLALLDLDDFKRINDQHGHDTGDAALRHLVSIARASLRPSDSVARYGGEEFVIVLPDTELDEAIEVLRRLQRELTIQYFMTAQGRLLITFSAGVTKMHPDEDSNDAMRRADQAMYLAKRSGKNRVVGG